MTDVRRPGMLEAAVLRSSHAHAPGAPRLFADTESNNLAVIQLRVGAVDAGLTGAPLVVRERFRHPRQTGAALETRGLVAVPPAPGRGELHLRGLRCLADRGGFSPAALTVTPRRVWDALRRA